MNKTKTKIIGRLIVSCLILNCTSIQAQIKPKTLRVGLLNQSFSLPSWELTKLPIHPTVNVGSEFRIKQGKHWRRTFGADFYYYYQKSTEHALMLDATYRLGYQFKFGLIANFTTALGYKHAILTSTKYKLNDGVFEEKTHFGKPQGNVKLGLGLEYPLSEKYSLTTDYKVMAVAPFGDRILPFSVNTFLGVGLKINLLN